MTVHCDLLHFLIYKKYIHKVPDSIRRKIKIFMIKKNLFNEELIKLGLFRIFEDDVFICSYPKSGNTWVRFLIANLIKPEIEITFRNIDLYVTEIEKCKESLNSVSKRPFMKTHWPFFNLFPKVIYIVRDPRDVYISFFHYSKNNGYFKGSLSDFIKDSNIPNYYGSWESHVQSAINYQQSNPSKIKILKYESLLDSPEIHLSIIADFLDIPYDDDSICIAVKKSSFSNLKKMELLSGPDTEGHSLGFFRSGKKGCWRENLSAADSEFLTFKFSHLLMKLGYSSN